VLVFPLYELVRSRLVNQPWGLIIPYAALNLPLPSAAYGYMAQIPFELEEAAAVDGLTPSRPFGGS